MSQECFQVSSVPAGKQAGEETRKQSNGNSNGNSIYCRNSKNNPFSNKGDTAREEDEDKASREMFCLFGKNPARTHFQVLGETQG